MKSDFKTSLEKLTPFYFTVDSTLHINQAGEGILTIAPNCINTHINSVVDINVITIKYQSNLSGLTADTEPVFCTFELHSIVLVGKLLKINKNSNEAFFIGVPIPETYDFVRELKLTGFDFSFLNDIQLTSYFNDRLVIIKDSFKLHTKIAHQRSQIELDLKNYTETINSLNEAVFEIDLQGNFIHVSSQWKGLSGYSNEDVAGTPFYLYIYEFDREEVLKVFYKLISGEENSITDKVRGVTKDGRVLLLNFSAKPLYNNDHVIYGVSGVLQDITESVYTENRLNLILDNINDEIVLTDINHDYVYVSPSVIKNRGYDSQQEFFNIKTSDNLHPEDYNKFLHLFLVEKLTEVNMEYRIRVKDGVYKWHQGNHKIVKDPITGADFLLTISRDISSNKDFQNQIDILTNHVDDETFGEWEKFEYWCEEIKPELMWKIVNSESEIFLSAFEKHTPKKYFKSKSAVKEKIIGVLTDGTFEDVENIMYVEIECKSKKLFLIYFDSDSWALGHGDSVLVVKSLAQLNKKNGYYPLS